VLHRSALRRLLHHQKGRAIVTDFFDTLSSPRVEKLRGGDDD